MLAHLKNIENQLTTMIPFQKTIAIPSWSKIDHRYALDQEYYVQDLNINLNI